MPAMTNPLPESQPAAKPAPVHHKPSRWPALLVLLACVGAGAAAYYYLTSARQAQAQQAAFTTTRTATVHRGPIETRVRLTGQTSARNFVNIVAPRLRGPDSGHPMVLLKIDRGENIVERVALEHADDVIEFLEPFFQVHPEPLCHAAHHEHPHFAPFLLRAKKAYPAQGARFRGSPDRTGIDDDKVGRIRPKWL